MPQIEHNRSLREFNSFGIEVEAQSFARFGSVEALKALLEGQEAGPIMILGGGSNVLFTKNVDALVLRNEIRGIDIVQEDDDFVFVQFGAGEVWHDCVMWAVDAGYAGIENLSLIPGSIGAAPMQNIGAYGVELKDVFHSLDALHLESHKVESFDAESCQFGYRESVFKKEKKNQYVILSVCLKLRKEALLNIAYGAIQSELERMEISAPQIEDISKAVINIRSSKLPDPKQIGNAGSFFKNPVIAVEQFEELKKEYANIPSYPLEEGVKVPAGWLIEQAGWKGHKEGDIGVHDKQALVLVNRGKGSGQEIYDLSQKILEDIKSRYGIELEREVNIV